MRHRLISASALVVSLALITSACASNDSDDSLVATESTDPAPTVVAAADPVEQTAVANAAPAESSSTIASTTTSIPTPFECAESVPLEIRVGQLIFPLVVQSDLAAAAELASVGHLGGVVVIGDPTASIVDDIAALQARSLLGPLIVAVDEEGGRVQRLASITSTVPSARTVAADLSLEEAKALAKSHAEAIGELGFTMNLAPVVDLDNGGFLGNRAYSADPALVSEYALATAEGIRDAGLTPVIKHFPGHGRGTDSHTGLPTLPGLDILREADLLPFIDAIAFGDLPIMVGHLVVPDLTNGKPATLSPEAIDGLLREELGFDGLVMTDAFNMDAISDTTSNADAAEQALAAGVDLVMLGGVNEVEATVAQVVAAVEAGTLDEATITESFLRVLDTRNLEICALPEDLRPKIGCESTVGGCG